MEKNKKHIVCLRFSSLGDVLLQSAFFSHLKKEYGDDIVLTLMTSHEFAGLFEGHPHVDRVLSFSRKESSLKMLKTFSQFQKENPVDFIFDLHNTVRANILKWAFWFIPKIAVDKRKIERTLLTLPVKLRLLEKTSAMQRVLMDFNFLWKTPFKPIELSKFIYKNQTEPDGLSSLKASFHPESRLESLKNFALKDKDYIVLIPSASSETKRWSLDRFLELAQLLLDSYTVVILGGPEDSFCEAFNVLAGRYSIVNLQGKTSFSEASDIVGSALICIGNDTGLMHMAEAQQTPCVMMMGPTSEEFGFAPHLKESYVFSHKLWCRPCSATGSKKCFRSKPYCLDLTSTEAVYQRVKEIMK